MQNNTNSMAPVSSLSVESRSDFIERIAIPMLNSWMMVMIAFIAVSWGATHLAHRLESVAAQYAAFALFVVAQSLIFAPMLWMAMAMDPSGSMIQSAAGVTVFGCAALIATVMITRKDFSFLRGVLVWGFFIVLGLIAASLMFGWNLGTWFSVGMIGFAGIAVLYDTSNIMHHYPQDKYVAASMALFASIAMMFWYILRLFMSRD
jgi:FtsH-binding integral membrane protein